MDRKEVKELLPIMQAFAEGKTIQSKQINEPDTRWRDIEECNFLREHSYRIKPKYRPFRTQKECWEEMHKHPDFGWVRYKGHFLNICDIGTDSLTICPDEHTETWDLSKCISEMTFTDNTPFGIKEE